MESFYTILFFILGTYMGSFFTVIGLRLPKGENFTTSRSKCDSCHHELKLFEMIPLVSYLLQKGRCRYCKEKIDSMFPILEFLTGVLFAVSFYSFGFDVKLLIALGVVSLLVIVTVSDLNFLIIPDEILIFFGIYFFIIQVIDLGLIGGLKQLGTGIFLFLTMYIIMLLGNFLFKKESLGGGDVKMMFIFGLILDPLLGTLAIFLGSLFALPMAIGLYSSKKEQVIPFGPFLLIAFTFIFFTKITSLDIINWLNF